MAKLVDAHDSGSCGEILGGSNPPIDNLFFRAFIRSFYFGIYSTSIGFNHNDITKV